MSRRNAYTRFISSFNVSNNKTHHERGRFLGSVQLSTSIFVTRSFHVMSKIFRKFRWWKTSSCRRILAVLFQVSLAYMAVETLVILASHHGRDDWWVTILHKHTLWSFHTHSGPKAFNISVSLAIHSDVNSLTERSDVRYLRNTQWPEKNGPTKQNAVKCTIYNTI